MPPTTNRPVVATIGAAYCANKGAGSMIQAIVDRFDDADIDVHSTYPVADRVALAHEERVHVVAAPAKGTAALDFPLALLIAVARLLRLPWGWLCRTEVLRSFRRADVVADITGISFSDSRPAVFAPYHFLIDAVPMLLGTPVVKCSQAIGPFESLPVKLTSRLVLPRLAAVIARGPATSQLLTDAGIEHLDAHDLAFAMKVDDRHRATAHEALERFAVPSDVPLVAVAPSTLVQGKSEAKGIDYVGVMADIVREVVAAADVHVVIVAHSSEPSEPENHESVPDRLNDLVCGAALAARLADEPRVTFLDLDLGPAALRALIDRTELVVTSRFHAMVSSLAVSTPVLVVGWSHKYGEVMSAFEIDDAVMDYETVDAEAIAARAIEMLTDRRQLAAAIERHVGDVEASALSNVDVLRRTIADGTELHR